MCYSLLGFVNDDVNFTEFQKICALHNNYYEHLDKFDADIPHHFPRLEGTIGFVLHQYCDCDSAIGRNDASQPELEDYLLWLHELRQCSSIRFLGLMKAWDPTKEIPAVQTLEVGKVNAHYLASMRDDTIYCLAYASDRIRE